MKRLLFIVLLVTLLSGCGHVTPSEAIVEPTETVGYDFLQLLPAPVWGSENVIQVYDELDGNKYGFFIRDTNDRTIYDAYVAATKSQFTIIKYNLDSGASGCTYEALTGDGKYVIDINYITAGKYVMVTVTRKVGV